MPSFRHVLLSCFVMLFCASCNTQLGPAPIDPAALKAGPALRTVNMFDTLRLSDDVSITFNSVTDDRCPKDVVCAWAGEASAGFLVKQDGKPDATLSLAWNAIAYHDPAKRYERVAGYRIYLMSLEPTPKADETLPAAVYKAELKIELDR